MIYAIEMASYDMISKPNFMKIVRGVQGILRIFFINFRGRNVGITENRDMKYAVEMNSSRRYTYQFPRRSVQTF
jgi:hypothetical protein